MKYKSEPEELQQRKRDFIDTYKPKPTPEPFFGFLTVNYTEPRQVLEKSDRKPLYMKVRILISKGYRIDKIL